MKKILDDKTRAECEKRLNEIKKETSCLRYELEGEPEEYDEEDFYERMYNNSPERQLDDLYQEQEELEEQLYRDDYYRKKQEFFDNNFDEQLNNQNKMSKVLGDTVSERDLLNREDKAIQLADHIASDAIADRFNIGVIGEWVSGKSTFLHYIKKKLDFKNQKDINIYTLSYDASSYSEQDLIWANFAKLLFEEYEKNIYLPELRFAVAKFNSNRKQCIGRFVVNIIIIIILFLITVGSQTAFSFDTIWSKFVGSIASVGGIIIFISCIAVPWMKKLLSASIPLSKKVIDTLKMPSYVEQLGTRERVSDDLKILLKAWLPKNNQKIVIFVDELDRCSEKGISEFFQAIQLFTEIQKINFVFAIELKHLKKALAGQHNIPTEEIDAYTTQYLEKYVSIIVPMENTFSYTDFIKKLINEVNQEDIFITEEECKKICECIRLIPRNKMTPRKIKKLLNLLVISKDCCQSSDKMLFTNYDDLFAWIIFNCFYHNAAEYVRSLYKKNKEYTPAERFIYIIKKDSPLQGLGGYMKIISPISMHDIVIYHKIANDLSIAIL